MLNSNQSYSSLLKLSPLFLALFVGANAFAETNELEDINVSASSDVTSTEHTKSYTTSAMKTTTGLELSPKETPQSVSVITKAQLDARGITSMEDALKTTTGINVIRENNKYRFQSRGFYINRIEEDGIASTVTGGANSNVFRDAQSMSDLAIYDHIEVVRGATGLTQGVGEPGGTINAVRKKPTSQFQAQGNFTFDRYGKARTMADVSGSLNQAKTLRGRFVAVVERDPTYKDLHNHNHLLYGVADAKLGENTVVTVGASYQNRHEQPDFNGLPLDTNGNDLGWDRDTYLGYDWSRVKTKKFNVFAESETFLNDNWRWTNKISYTKGKATTASAALANTKLTYKGFSNGDTLATNGIIRYDNESDQIGFNSGLTGTYELFGRKHDLFTNYTYSYERHKSRYRYIQNSEAYNPLTFSGNEVAYPDWSDVYYDIYYNSRTINHGIMLGTRFNILDNLHLIAGTRYTNWRNINNTYYHWYDGEADGEISYNIVKRSRFIPYAGLTYDIDENNSLYASYTSIFKPQSYKDQDGKVLDPVIGSNYELGWKGEWFNGRLNTSLALFQIIQKNRSIYVNNSGGTPSYYYVPTGKIRSRGFELEVSGNLTENWQLYAGYTYNKSKYLETELSYNKTDNATPYNPKHLFRLYTSYNLPVDEKKWTIGAGVNFQTRTSSIYNYYVVSNKTYYGAEQASYAVWDANVHYQWTPNIGVRFAVNNIFDKRYFQNNKVRIRGANNFYGEPRNFVLSVDWKF